MADSKVTALTENSTPAAGDLAYIVDDPGGTPASQKITLANLKTFFNDITTDAEWDAKGDIVAGTGANTADRLAVGANNTVLMADSGEATGLKWSASPIVVDTAWDAKGDLVAGTAANTAGVLTVGANGTVLTAASGETTGLSWATPATVATDAVWDAAGDLVQGTGANTAARLALGTANQLLRVNAGETAAEWATIASGSVTSLKTWRASENEPPASAYATFDTRNGHPVLDFDATTDEEAVFSYVMPQEYAAGGITLLIHYAMTSATSGNVVWQAAFERVGDSQLDIDSDSFEAFNSSGQDAVSGTSGHVMIATITFTDGADMDSVAAGEGFRLKIRRDADDTSATDDATGDAELRWVEMQNS